MGGLNSAGKLDTTCGWCEGLGGAHAEWCAGDGDHPLRSAEQHPPEAARKDDAGKPRWSLLFGAFRGPLEEIIKIREHGIQKYGGDTSWQDVPNGEERYREALARHVVAYLGGEDLDPDSGRPHLAHAGINVLFLLWFRARRLAGG